MNSVHRTSTRRVLGAGASCALALTILLDACGGDSTGPPTGKMTVTATFTADTIQSIHENAVHVIATAAGAAAPAEVLVGIEFAGSYGFTLAHYLDQLGYGVVGVLPVHTKRWKEVAHNQPLKTDAKDALGNTDLAAQGHFVSVRSSGRSTTRYAVGAVRRITGARPGRASRSPG